MLWLTVVAAFGLIATGEPENSATTFYVQLVRGTNDGQPPQTGVKAIGPKLTNKLQPVFRWKNYWEMNRVKVAVMNGEKRKIRLSKRHEVEIDLSARAKRMVRFCQDGKLVSASTQPAGETLTIQGQNTGGENAWFIVVRRDKPSD